MTLSVTQLPPALAGDSTSVIAAALASGATVVRGVPGSTYSVTTLTVPAGVTLEQCTLVQITATTGNLVTLGAGSVLRDCSLDGNASNQSASNDGVRLNPGSGGAVSRVSVTNTKGVGISAMYVKESGTGVTGWAAK